MTDRPDLTQFSVNERPREYEVRVDVTGEVSLTIMADSVDDARSKADAMMEDDEFGMELDEVHSARIANVRKSSALYRVSRNGRSMQVSRLDDGDIPREPDERGF